MGDEYASLFRLVQERGLLNRSYSYYALKILFNIALLAVGIAVLALMNSFAIQLLNAVFLAFVFTQIAFIAHDASHRQVFHSTTKNDLAGMVHLSLLLGVSYHWWYEKHTEHHAHPNEDGVDPDITFPMLAFSEEQAATKRGLFRFIVRYQFIFFPFLVTFMALHMRFHSIRVLLSERRVHHRIPEILMIATHLAAYAVLLHFLPLWQAFSFFILHHALIGIYFSLVFAPNHKGMPLMKKGERPDFIRSQVLTARNVIGSPVADFFYGGLNYQIEHHLFTQMPRNNLKKAQRVVERFCGEHAIPYHKTGVLGSWQEIFSCLYSVAQSVKSRKVSTEGQAHPSGQ
jgi:fatty acid desaturase